MHTSRLWRDEQAKVLITREIRKLNGEIISIEQPRYSLYTKDPQDFLYNSMMEMLDTYERMCISMKLAKGRATKARQGEKPTGVAPYGYMYSADKKAYHSASHRGGGYQADFQDGTAWGQSESDCRYLKQ